MVWYQPGTRLVPDWYQTGTSLVPAWYQPGTRYQIGTSLVPGWYRPGSSVVPPWYHTETTLAPDARALDHRPRWGPLLCPTVHPPRCAPQGEPSHAGPRVLRPTPFMRARENAFLRRFAEPFSDVQVE